MMRQPTALDKVSTAEISDGPYPPCGFQPFYEAELGNGDYFGLYWPIGMEDAEPVVCDMIHDEWRIEPAFSNLDTFLNWLELNKGERGESPVEDDEMALNRFNKARSALRNNEPSLAIQHLRAACKQLPEVSAYWLLLATQCFRLGDDDAGAHAAVQAYCSNWAFGIPSDNVFRVLRRASRVSKYKDDPLLKRLDEFDLKFGGTKENRNYPIMLAVVEDYLRTQPVLALRLHQNFAYMMTTETGSFQARYGFELDAWRREHKELREQHFGPDRLQ